MAQGSAFPVKEQVNLAFTKISSAVWSPEGPTVFFQLPSVTSWFWLGEKCPRTLSGRSTVPHLGLCPLSSPALLRDASSVLFLWVPANFCAREQAPGRVGSKRLAKQRPRKEPMPLRAEWRKVIRGWLETVDLSPSKVPHPPPHLPKNPHHQHTQGYWPFLCFPNSV